MSLHRFFDIVVENESGDMPIDKEFILEVADRDMSTAMDRAEHLGDLFDAVVAASGLNVCSFSSELVRINSSYDDENDIHLAQLIVSH